MGWQETNVESDPLLIVGLRSDRGIVEGFRVNIDDDVSPALRKVAADTLDWLNDRTAVAYTPYVDPEDGEYLTIAASTLPPKPARGKDASSEKEETAVIVALIRDSDVLPEMGAGELIKRLEDGALYLQAICLSANKERIGFVTKAKSQQVMKRSSIPLGKHDKNDRLKKVARPALVLESDVHAVGLDPISVVTRGRLN